MLFAANGCRRGGRRRRSRRVRPAKRKLQHWLRGDLEPHQFVVALVIASAVSMGTFAHADRHGSSHATAWGVGAFLFAALVVPVYFGQYWLRTRRAA